MVTALLFLAAVGCLTSLTAAQQAGCSNIPTSAQVATLIAQNYGSGQGSQLPTITLRHRHSGIVWCVHPAPAFATSIVSSP